ncbi:alanine dehydrogenase [Parasulfuritortus cantonensis]|uniref:Alanine dehydrogenase n=1 Tax=Parasulfuritortus cantonensis TaxID=2528202 RepID=A0A4R1BKV5_9PROT|nr:alanine dehydrogenase [Parasulfuritortus cantonensis]TCJ18030.1 alanine dehydrogenase [Parasulfuritortus cantonensis]
MRIGVPKEIKPQEHRVALTPAGAARLVGSGHAVVVESGAGAAIGYGDADYRDAGAELAGSAAAVYAADLVFKVKEPLAGEIPLLRRGQVLFCYLHLAAVPELAHALVARGVTAIAFETVEDAVGRTPLLAPMSRVAGRMAVQVGMQALEMTHGGRGVLLAGVDAVAPGRVLVVGAGEVGANAAHIAVGVGAEVVLLDRDPERLASVRARYPGRVETLLSDPGTVAEQTARADLVVGAVYLHGRRAPKLITRDLVRRMRRGAALVDVAIDQGGIAETSRVTRHDAPFFVEEGVVHYGVANMPGAVAHTSTLALEAATLAYLERLAGLGPGAALAADPGFAAGLNVAGGRICHPGLAGDLGLPATPWQDALFT